MKEKKNFRLWLAALALAIPSLVIAQGMPGDDPIMNEPAEDRRPDAPTEDETRPSWAGDEAATDMTQEEAIYRAAQEKANADMKSSAEVKSALLPMVAGIGAGEMGASVLHLLADTEYFERRDARSTTRLAKLSVALAQDRAYRIQAMKNLSSDARMAARNAHGSLKEAQMAVQGIERQVGDKAGRLDRARADAVQREARKLHGALANARRSIDRVAAEYRISTKLDFTERGKIISRE